MPLRRNPVLEALSELRDTLREAERQATGHTPVICEDDALHDMVRSRPLKPADFHGIQGLDAAFIEQYSHHFLAVLYAHRQSTVHEVTVSKSSQKILHNYKDRLSNLSRRNRNLHVGRLPQRLGVDLCVSHLLDSLPVLLFGKNRKTLRLTKVRPSQTSEEETFHRKLTTLYREINRDAREKGAYDLFIAYPFVEGKLQGEAFEVKAPLLYFPVMLERKGLDFVLHVDSEKDVLFNRDLLLTNNKISHLSEIGDSPNIEPFSLDAIHAQVLKFYRDHHIQITGTLSNKQPFEPFKDTVLQDFKKMRKGDLHLKAYVVLGKYPMHASKLQEDLTQIINKKKYNDLLETLLESPYQTHDYQYNTPFIHKVRQQFSEKSLTYINDLNHAQERVIDLVHKHEQLVIWGPPGTGKSQTITSLIADQISRGGNVLVVSEKKAAIDVIRSRLGHAARYTMFLDDAQDKQAFYAQISKLIDPLPPGRTVANDPARLDTTIETTLTALKAMHTQFYTPLITDVPASSLYHRYLSEKQLEKWPASLQPEPLHDLFYKTFKPLSFKTLKTLEETFDQPALLKQVLTYRAHQKQHPFLNRFRRHLTRSEKLRRTAFYKEAAQHRTEYDAAGSLKRRRLKKHFIKTHWNTLEMIFERLADQKAFLKALHETELLDYVRSSARYFDAVDAFLAQLDSTAKRYLELLESLPLCDLEDRHLVQSHIFDAVYTGYIERFEALNHEQVATLERYEDTMRQLHEDMREKQQLCRESLEMNLYRHALDFSNSRRIMDIKRRLESPRKWRVARFIDTYQLEMLANIKVWMLTPEVVSEVLPLNYAMFDLVIFDEASQMYVEKAIPTIYRANKVVIAGDTKQLRPSSLGQGRFDGQDALDEDDDPDVSLDAQSLLDLARYKYQETLLNYHYRSAYEELIAFSNHAFYEGKLIVSPNMDKPKKPPIEFHVVPEGRWENRANRAEAEKVVELVKLILRTRKENETIGIITFNVNQRDLVEDLLDEALFSGSAFSRKLQAEANRFEAGEDRSLFVKNIENVQGDERDIIIFSTAYARNRDGRFMRQFGWLNAEGGQNRLNVAISRAKRKIHLVTSMLPAEFHVEDLKSQGPKLLKTYMMYCHAVSNGDRQTTKDILQQLASAQTSVRNNHVTTLHEAVRARLQRDHLTVEENIGIGGHTIDLAVYDPEQKRYRIGILLDVEDETHRADVRELFYHRQKFLEARGWHVYRVFAPNWFKDANQEMRAIRKCLKETEPS
ncbi:MAG: DUF4011 domain-containing protein [Acholeplasmatales bacterium]|nr:MAG: DUF4011 domain-containing protein [Acholeplasmatales bacterium]